VSDEVVVERPAEGVALLRLNRPAVRNALNMPVRRAIAENFLAFTADASVRVVVLTGDDRAFAAGADLNEFHGVGPVEVWLRGTRRLWQAVADCPKPVIAGVRGLALGGGCELAMHADIIIAGESARFGQPEIKLGLMPGAGGTQRLVRALGKFKAMRMLLTGDPVSAAEAFAMGLASEVTADDQVLPRALALAAQIAALPPLAAQQIKEVVRQGEDLPLDAALSLEQKAFQVLLDSADTREGIAAFLEKRKPVVRGL